jgi:hypothetical protein
MIEQRRRMPFANRDRELNCLKIRRTTFLFLPVEVAPVNRFNKCKGFEF